MFEIKKNKYNIKIYFNKYEIFSMTNRSKMRYDFLREYLLNIQKKQSMINSIWRNDDILFYVPNYPSDFVQSVIVNTENFFEIDILEELKNYIPKNAVILDIGANIGNHTIYFAKRCNALKVYSFEPIHETFNILKKNIEINNIGNIVELYNLGLSDKNTMGDILKYSMHNIGATKITHNINGNLKLNKLDNINIDEDRIDFIKIDVEGHEINLLRGAENTLSKYKPSIFIEVFDENKSNIFSILENLGYKYIKEFDYSNYLFIHKSKA